MEAMGAITAEVMAEVTVEAMVEVMAAGTRAAVTAMEAGEGVREAAKVMGMAEARIMETPAATVTAAVGRRANVAARIARAAAVPVKAAVDKGEAAARERAAAGAEGVPRVAAVRETVLAEDCLEEPAAPTPGLEEGEAPALEVTTVGKQGA
jgi:hypothetical protein